MAMFHSFWFEPAKHSFTKVLEHDPECGMAYWGIAIMSMGNPFGWSIKHERAEGRGSGHGGGTARERQERA